MWPSLVMWPHSLLGHHTHSPALFLWLDGMEHWPSNWQLQMEACSSAMRYQLVQRWPTHSSGHSLLYTHLMEDCTPVRCHHLDWPVWIHHLLSTWQVSSNNMSGAYVNWRLSLSSPQSQSGDHTHPNTTSSSWRQCQPHMWHPVGPISRHTSDCDHHMV